MTRRPSQFVSNPIPACAGIGLRTPHCAEVIETKPDIGFFEVHTENYFGLGGARHRMLEAIRADYPLSFHGVGLSLGSTDPLNLRHVARTKELADHYEPALLSEHLSWGSVEGRYLNDLLPLPYTQEALDLVVARIQEVQDRLQRQILVENVSSYLEFEHSTLSEWDFVTETAQRSGCGILLDVNNVYVNAVNHGFEAQDFFDGVPAGSVQEIHLAGHTVNEFDDGRLLIDTHNQPVCDAVWSLYETALRRSGPVPTLVEWDTDLPDLAVLVTEAATAQRLLERCDDRAA